MLVCWRFGERVTGGRREERLFGGETRLGSLDLERKRFVVEGLI